MADEVGKDDGKGPLWVLGHLPLILSMAPLLIVFLRIAGASSFEPTTLSLILGSTSTFDLVFMSVIQVVPPLAAVVCAILWTNDVAKARALFQQSPIVANAAALGVVLCLLMTPPVGVAVIACVALFNWGVPKLVRCLSGGRRGQAFFRDVTGWIFSFVLVFFVTAKGMWLPAEQFEMRDAKPLVGYVLDEGDGQKTVLLESDRQITVLLDADIKSRRPCRVLHASRPLVSYLYLTSRPATVDRCPK